MRKLWIIFFGVSLLFVVAFSCSNEGLNATNSGTLSQTTIDLAQTSGQLASGTTFSISGSATDSTGSDNNRPDHGHGHHDKHKGILDGLNLLAPTDELLAIIDAETASDIRGLRISHNGGATITHYDSAGNEVTLALTAHKGPEGCSFSGHQYPNVDSLLASIVKTEIDFGTGVTYKRDTVEITRSGKIIITRSTDGSTVTEVTTFQDYFVNGSHIEGVKTRISNYDATTGSGSSTTTVSDGKITFSDGTVATWMTDRSRVSDITLDADTGKPVSGTISTEVNTSVIAIDGTVIYSHKAATPLVENIACEGRRRAPVSGTLETTYRSDIILVDFGDGSCTNKTITITFNGVTTTKTIGG